MRPLSSPLHAATLLLCALLASCAYVTKEEFDALRDEVGLTGAKEGCGTGDCGACSILMEGRVTCSCLVFAPETEGADITTVEGLAGENGPLSALQEAFSSEHGLQCGYCTPGILMNMTDFLKRHPDPSDEEIRTALIGNLCRCTGYVHIVRAVRTAADRLKIQSAGGPQHD